ncbi:D-alanine--D-alanine ligase family protein [Leptolinea tardivitalis]|uniref:D-alanine--D-alanine ligase n=1 Tax=Leptolinea tardivitalis TaxID=229920 RepID=A0A0P6WYW0_9CHLR|nr:D-alanine--D-alanine ligase family protein [Leptolinea tardivitalis]KPL71879.1 D-alanine--D-alanine ligase [Leptolinea tardivitalis]GAP20285.1 D-alanine-D-alanine ligase [Leptolinea tardivitalis]
MAKKIHIGVIFGGRSGEHAVSLMSARSVLSVMDTSKYDITQIGITKNGVWYTGEDVLSALEKEDFSGLQKAILLPVPGEASLYSIRDTSSGSVLELAAQLDIIFPVLHGTFGEDGTLQGLLELADIAYVGAGVLGSSVGMDKSLFKDVMRTHGIPVVESITVTRKEIETDLDGVITRAEKLSPYPFFVKPANLGSSVGITKCRSRGDLLEGLMDAARYDRRILVERGLVNPREIEISVLGNQDPKASVAGEVMPEADFYSYAAKYLDGSSKLGIPADLPEDVSLAMRNMAVEAYKAIDCAGMARVDFLMDRETGEYYLNELNTLPGFTKISMYPKMWDATGLPYPQLIDRLIDLAFERKADRDHTVRTYEG